MLMWKYNLYNTLHTYLEWINAITSFEIFDESPFFGILH